MAGSREALREAEILFMAQTLVSSPVCQDECKGGKIHRIRKRDGAVIIHCKGEICITSAEKIKPMSKKNKGGSTG